MVNTIMSVAVVDVDFDEAIHHRKFITFLPSIEIGDLLWKV